MRETAAELNISHDPGLGTLHEACVKQHNSRNTTLGTPHERA